MAVFNKQKCLTWFFHYTTYSNSIFGPTGMKKFCNELGIDPEDKVMLALAWRMNAKSMGYFTSAEWLKGLTELQCDSVKKLQEKLNFLREYFNDALTFKSIYRYAYDFAKEKNQRYLDFKIARSLLKLLFEKQWELYPLFMKFIDQSEYKVINKDQWNTLLEFSQSIDPDLSNYDVDGPWPSMLDEFVDWLKNNK